MDNSNLPPLPEGYELEDQPSAVGGRELPPLPEGYELDEPASREPQSFGTWAKQQAAAALAGAGQSIPFAQDASAAIAASLPNAVAPSYVPREAEWPARFEAAKRAQMAAADKAWEVAPAAKGLGVVGGIVGTLPAYLAAAPEAAVVSRLSPYVGPIIGEVAGTGLTGAGIGAVQGLGEGATADERVHNAGFGALAGGGLGVGLPMVAKGLGAGFNTVKEAFSPTSKVARMAGDDVARGLKPLSLDEVNAARARGQEVLPIDLGGKQLHGEARRVSNISPEAESTLTNVLADRQAKQQQRYGDLLHKMTGHDLDAAGVVEKMRSSARAINAPAYRTAYEKGAGGVWNEDLFRLVNAPSIQKAIPEAVSRLNERAVVEGGAAVKNPFVKDAAGNYFLPEGFKPPLEFWDGIKRTLDDKVSALERKGKFDKAREVSNVRRQLLSTLDKEVPEFAQARAGAAKAFGEDNAFDAGMNFLRRSDTATTAQEKAAFNKMSPQEQEHFANGLLLDMRHRIGSQGGTRDVAKLFDSPVSRSKLELALGAERAGELEAFVRVEELMARSHRAVQGNSTTPRQLSMMGAVRNFATHSPLPIAGVLHNGWAAGLGIAAAEYIAGKMANAIGRARATKIAEQLVSDDPNAVQEVAASLARNPKAMGLLRNITRSASIAGAGAATKRGAVGSVEYMPDASREARAKGGKVNSRDYPAKRLSRMEKAAAKAKEALALESRSIMHVPDEQVANALRIAERK